LLELNKSLKGERGRGVLSIGGITKKSKKKMTLLIAVEVKNLEKKKVRIII